MPQGINQVGTPGCQAGQRSSADLRVAFESDQAYKRLASPAKEGEEALRDRMLQEQSTGMAVRHRKGPRQCLANTERLPECLQGADGAHSGPHKSLW